MTLPFNIQVFYFQLIMSPPFATLLASGGRRKGQLSGRSDRFHGFIGHTNFLSDVCVTLYRLNAINLQALGRRLVLRTSK